jgi:hypothetical protein
MVRVQVEAAELDSFDLSKTPVLSVGKAYGGLASDEKVAVPFSVKSFVVRPSNLTPFDILLAIISVLYVLIIITSAFTSSSSLPITASNIGTLVCA